MVCQSDWLPMIMATDFAPGGAKKIPCAKEAMHYTVTPRGGKAMYALRLTSCVGSETETLSRNGRTAAFDLSRKSWRKIRKPDLNCWYLWRCSARQRTLLAGAQFRRRLVAQAAAGLFASSLSRYDLTMIAPAWGLRVGSILPFVPRGVFDDATTRIMGEAFDAACKDCTTLGSQPWFKRSWPNASLPPPAEANET